MLKVTVVSALLAFTTAANAAPLFAPATGSDSQAFRQAHTDHYLLSKGDIDAYADNVGANPAYMFLQRDPLGKIQGSVWVIQGPDKSIKEASVAIQKARGTLTTVETHDIAACTSLGGRSFQVKEKQEQEADGAITTFNTSPAFTSVTIATGTGVSGELKLLSMQDVQPLLNAGAKQGAYISGWRQMFAAESEAHSALPAPPVFCDSKQFVWPGTETLPLALGQPVTNAGTTVANGTTTLKGSYKLFGAEFTSAEVKVSAQKLVSASYSADGSTTASFDSIVSTLKSKYGEPYVHDHATHGNAVTDTVAYRESPTTQTALVVQLLKRDKADATGQLVVSTRLP